MEIIIAALISGVVSGAAGAIVSNLFHQRKKLKQLETIPPARRQQISGSWRGDVRQNTSSQEEAIEFKVDIQLNAADRLIEGIAKYNYSNENIFMGMEGGFYDHDIRLIKLNYINKKKGVIHHGVAIMELSANGKKLKGEFLGFGKESDKLVSGSIDLSKIN